MGKGIALGASRKPGNSSAAGNGHGDKAECSSGTAGVLIND
jgi:hypothetical protein